MSEIIGLDVTDLELGPSCSRTDCDATEVWQVEIKPLFGTPAPALVVNSCLEHLREGMVALYEGLILELREAIGKLDQEEQGSQEIS